MQGAVPEPETKAPAMEWSPAPARRRPKHVLERKLGELEACLAGALTSRPRRSDVNGSLFAEIKARTDFLRTLIAAEVECHGGARPEHLVEAEERFAVLEGTFEQWARRGVADAVATEEVEEPDEAADGSGSSCSCNDSCFGVECTGPEIKVTKLDSKCNSEREAAEAHKLDAKCNSEREAAEAHKAAAIEVAPTMRRTPSRCWCRRCAALCGAAGAVAVVALGAGLALELCAVARQNVHPVPT